MSTISNWPGRELEGAADDDVECRRKYTKTTKTGNLER